MSLNLGYAMFSDTLLKAAAEQDHRKVHAAFAAIHALDGDSGIVAMLDSLLDQAIAGRPAPEEGSYYALTAVAFTPDSDTPEGIDEMPYELRWALRMISARLNRDADTVTSLIASADEENRLPTCSLMLALVAGQTSTQEVGK